MLLTVVFIQYVFTRLLTLSQQKVLQNDQRNNVVLQRKKGIKLRQLITILLALYSAPFQSTEKMASA